MATSIIAKPPKPLPAPTPPKNRMTVVQYVYHQVPGEQPKLYESRFSRELTTIEQPYVRITQIGSEWIPLDLGWLKDCGVGTVVIENNEGQRFQVIPTKEEKEVISKREVEIALCNEGEEPRAFLFVPPTETVRFSPRCPNLLKIRCLQGHAKITIQVFPK